MVSQAIAPNASRRPFVLRKGISMLSDLRDGAAAYGFPGDYPGRIYYVNNIHGASTNEGLSWDQPFDEITTAITASEAYRALYTGSTNDYQRNIIFVQGTGTAYAQLTAMPMYADIVGIGADPRGNGAGIPRVGADAGTGGGGILCTASMRGFGLYNLQFQAGTDLNAATFTNVFRARIENCAFMGNNDCANPATGFQAAIISGFVMRDCHFGSALHDFMVSFDMTGGAYFMNAVVENCVLHGQTAGFRIAQGYTQTQGSVLKNNVIASGRETCAIGVDDNMNSGDIPHLQYTGNYVNASTDATIVDDHTARWMANYAGITFSTSTNS